MSDSGEELELPDDAAFPSYLRPNAASTMSEYSNAESEYIRAAFSSGSCLPIRSIPEDIKPSALTASLRAKADSNRRSIPEPTASGGKKDVFKQFEYVSSRYSLADELKRRDRLEAESKRMAISGKAFIGSDTRAKMKHEDTFEDKEFRFPHLGDEYDAGTEQRRRMQWIKDSKILHGPFVPSGKHKPLEAPDKSVMPVILKEIHRLLNSDWGEYRFEVLATEDDLVVVRFDLTDLESERGVQAYMNVFASSSDVCVKYKLARVTEDWHSKPGGDWLYYMLRPPWVRVRITDTYFTLHPEERTVAGLKDRLSATSGKGQRKGKDRGQGKATRGGAATGGIRGRTRK